MIVLAGISYHAVVTGTLKIIHAHHYFEIKLVIKSTTKSYLMYYYIPHIAMYYVSYKLLYHTFGCFNILITFNTICFFHILLYAFMNILALPDY